MCDNTIPDGESSRGNLAAYADALLYSEFYPENLSPALKKNNAD